VLIITKISLFEGMQKSFIVLGAHSSKETVAYFRPLKTPKQIGSPTSRMKSVIKERHSKKKKTAFKKTLKKKKPIIKEKLEEKKIEKKKELVEEPVKQEQPKEKTVSEPMSVVLGDVAGITLTRFYKDVQREVARVWRPPVGVPRGTECVLSLEIDDKGDVKKFELSERSKVLIYDLSVLQAAREFKFEKSLWNSSLFITFRQ